MVVVGTMKDLCSWDVVLLIDLPCDLIFIPSDHIAQGGTGEVGCHGMVNEQEKMDMVWHDHKVVNMNLGEFAGDGCDVRCCYRPVRLRDGRPVPYNAA